MGSSSWSCLINATGSYFYEWYSLSVGATLGCT